MKTLSCLLVCLLAVLAPRSALAEVSEKPLDDRNQVRARLVASVDRAALGEEFEVGVLLEIASGWHIYWTYPGNTGKPTVVSLRSDERHTKVLEPRFPGPEVFDAEHVEDLSFGYQGSVLIPASALVFEAPPGGRTPIAAHVSWLACKQACVSGEVNLTLELETGESLRPSPLAARFAEAGRSAPAALAPDRAFLQALIADGSSLKLRYLVRGLGTDLSFAPRWSRGACKIQKTRVLPDGKDALLEVELRGLNCFPDGGGVVWAGEAGARKAYAFGAAAPPNTAPADAEPSGALAAPEEAGASAKATAPLPAEEPLWLMLLFALLGGLLLNVMPCVIPVVIPKLLHVVRTAQKAEDPAEKRRLLWSNALAYTGGVAATLLSLAGLVLALKHVGTEVGWGFQFQNPWFLTFMVALLFVLGLGMLHVFPLEGPRHHEDLKQLRRHRQARPLLESFMTGLLVTFLGTPCTAPMLGPALGYAFTQSDPIVVLFFLAVALGLAMPFLLLGAWTGWTRLLPTRVTERYDRIMRGMAFLLFGTAVWLQSVLASAYGAEAAANVLWFMLALGTGAWLFGLFAEVTDSWGRRFLKLLPIALSMAAAGYFLLDFSEARAERRSDSGRSDSERIRWQPFSEARLSELRAAGKSVFVDFTADWCMNCKANERLVIETESTSRLIEELRIAPLKADFTKRDPIVQAWLKRHGRAGVPMYLVYPACSGDDRVMLLPEILTSERLHEALRQAGPSRAGCGV